MTIIRLAIGISVVAMLSIAAVAQADGPPAAGGENFDKPSDDRGRVIARALGLSEEQRLQIREINRRQRQHLRLAQLRLQTARAAADIAIYDDVLDEAEVEKRVRDVASAQAEITRIRMMSEVAVRTVLSPEQLVKFRMLREQFANRRRRLNQRRNSKPRVRNGLNRRRQDPQAEDPPR